MPQIGKYEIVKEIGRSSFATLYEGFDPAANNKVLIKVIDERFGEDPQFVAAFHAAVDQASQLNHPGIARVYGSAEDAGLLYAVTELVDSKSLENMIAGVESIPLPHILTILKQLGAALDYAHQHIVSHGDLNPSHIYLRVVDRKLQVKVTDFGLARAATAVSPTFSLDPAYLAPERLENGPSFDQKAADRYALGVIAYEMFTGRKPFSGTAAEILAAHQAGTLTPPSTLRTDLPQAFDKPVLRMLSRSPVNRYPTAVSLVQEIEKAIQVSQQKEQQAQTLASLYTQLQANFRQNNWSEAVDISRQINKIDPQYRDTNRLAAEAQKRAKIKSTLDKLAGEMQSATAQHQWQRVIDLGGQIRQIDPNYPRVNQLIQQAQLQLNRQHAVEKPVSHPVVEGRRESQPPQQAQPPKPARSRGLGFWLAIAGGVMVCSVLACVGSYFIYNNFFSENGQTVAAGQISQILQTTPITAAPTLQEPEATQPSIDINYVTITDSSNSLVMDVPETWGDINGIPQAGLDGTGLLSLAAAPNIDEFINTFSTPGVLFQAGPNLGLTMQDALEATNLSLPSLPANCQYQGRFNYVDPVYTGLYDIWGSCGGLETEVMILHAEPQNRGIVVGLVIMTVNQSDLEARERILNSFEVAE